MNETCRYYINYKLRLLLTKKMPTRLLRAGLILPNRLKP